MDCGTCHGFCQWWEWQQSPGVFRRSFAKVRPTGIPGYAVHRICTECIGGIASCCDGAGSAQPDAGDAA